MKIIIDADGCPVVKLTVDICKEHKIPLTIVKNINHNIISDYGDIVTVDFARDSADYYIANHMEKGDVVVTQDYGLCAMILSRGGYPITQNGLVIDNTNIDDLLARRHFNQEQRRKHKKFNSKFKKRDSSMDEKYKNSLYLLLRSLNMLQ